MKTKTVISCIFTFLLILTVIQGFASNDEDGGYYRIGNEYRRLGDFDKAVESYKKVLYVNNTHYRSSLALAEIYEAQKNIKQSIKEYSYTLNLLEKDMNIVVDDRSELINTIQEKINALENTGPDKKKKYTGALTILEINIILLAVTIILGLCTFAFAKVFTCIRKKSKYKQQSKIWLDCYWERREEKVVNTFSDILWHIAFYVVGIFIIGSAIKIIMFHGYNECLKSFHGAVTSLF